MAAPKKTLAQYLQWAALAPRTNGWSALVAYDKNKCNQLLLQEYIEKYDKHSVMPPINQSYGTTDSGWSWLVDYVTDAPRLSFENNPDINSAEVNMSMAIVGGKELTLDDSSGFAQVNRISSFDPLDHPSLVADRVELKDVEGSVSNDGEVVLDLGDPRSQRYIWEVKGDRIQHQRRMAGAFFKRKFREADPVRRTFTLGTLAKTTQEFMKPQSFKLRTVMEAGAATRGAENFGNGAVEMRIAMDDEITGGLPGEDWAYPLPSDRPDLNVLTIFGTHFFMHGIIGKGSARAFNSPSAQFNGERNSDGFFYKIKVKQRTSGDLIIPPFEATVGGKMVRFFDCRIPIYINDDKLLTMTLYYSPNALPYFEVGMGGENERRVMKCQVNGQDIPFRMGLGLSATYQFSIDETSRRLKVTMRDYHSYTSFDSLQDLPSDVRNYIDSEQFKTQMGDIVANTAMTVFNGLEEIDIFALHTLLFNAEDAVQFKTLNLTGEMVLFGSINPRLTTFAIGPEVEVMLAYDGTHQFRTVPNIQGVKWTVEDLDGNTTGVGRMIESSGAYTAPPLADIHGTYKRIKVIATGPGTGNDRHISRALITVVARAITLNPLIVVCPSTKPGEAEQDRKFSAHTMGSGTLIWRVNGDGEIDRTADENGDNTYRAPLELETPGTPSFTIDEVIVENTTTGQQQKSLVVLTRRTQSLAVSTVLQGTPPNQVKLIAKLTGTIRDPKELTYECIPADAGSIDADTGVFTASETTSSQFALLTVAFELPEFNLRFEGYSLQPLPLAELPPKPPKEDPQTSALDELNSLLESVYENFEQLSQDSGARERTKECLDHIASLAEDIQNGQ
jgi:hypothetical protein